MLKRPIEDRTTWRLHADDVRESFKLRFESVKQVTTLTAGSFLLSATFLNTIFPTEGDAPPLGYDIKILIGSAFLCFALSLVFSTLSMWRIAALIRSRREYYRKKFKIRWNIVLPSFFYILGLSLFGTAVLESVLNIGNDKVLATARASASTLISVKLEEENIPALSLTEVPPISVTPKFILYALLIAFLVTVTSWFGARLIKGYRRDRSVDYVIVYPSSEFRPLTQDEILLDERQPIVSEVVLSAAFFVIAAFALGEDPSGLQLRSVDMFLIGLSLLAEAIIFRPTVGAGRQNSNPGNESRSQHKPHLRPQS